MKPMTKTEINSIMMNEVLDLRERFYDLDRALIGWKFEVRTLGHKILGTCNYRDMIIKVSDRFICRDTLIDTVRHELAHVMAPGAGHGTKWRTWCRHLGARPRAKTDIEVGMLASPEKPYKWKLVYVSESGDVELIEERSRRSSMKNRYVAGRPETKNRLFFIESRVYDTVANNSQRLKYITR